MVRRQTHICFHRPHTAVHPPLPYVRYDVTPGTHMLHTTPNRHSLSPVTQSTICVNPSKLLLALRRNSTLV